MVDVRRLLDTAGAEHGQGVELEAVAQAEQQIGPLPDDYRGFLVEVGWATFGPEEVAGLGLDLPHRRQSVVELTKQERLDGGLPGHWWRYTETAAATSRACTRGEWCSGCTTIPCCRN